MCDSTGDPGVGGASDAGEISDPGPSPNSLVDALGPAGPAGVDIGAGPPAGPGLGPASPAGPVGSGSDIGEPTEDDPAFSMRTMFPLDVRNDPAVSNRAFYGDRIDALNRTLDALSVLGRFGLPNPLSAVASLARGALSVHAGQSTADTAAAAATPVSAEPGSPGLVLSGPAQMTTTAVEGAFAPGGVVAQATGQGAPQGGTATQKANAAARFGGGISPAFMANLALLDTLKT